MSRPIDRSKLSQRFRRFLTSPKQGISMRRGIFAIVGAVALAGGENVFTADAAWSPDDVVALDVAAWVSADPGGSTYAALAGIDELAAIPAIRDGRVITAPRDGYPVDAALPRALEDLADRLRAQPGAS